MQSIKDTLKRHQTRSRNGSQSDKHSPRSAATPETSRESTSSVRDAMLRTPVRSRSGSHVSESSSLATGPHASVQSSVLSNPPSVVLPLGQASPLPQINPNDPRALDAKLSAFVPQSAHMSAFRDGSTLDITTMSRNALHSPPLSNTSSRNSRDHNDASPASVQASYYDLSQSNVQEDKTSGRKGWLAETFLSPNGINKRRPSISRMLRRKDSVSHSPTARSANSSQVASERGAPSPVPPSEPEVPPVPSRTETPSLPPADHLASVNGQQEHIDRHTSTQERPKSPVETAPPLVSSDDAPPTAKDPLPVFDGARLHVPAEAVHPMRSQKILERLGAVLALGSEARPDVLDDPPRSLMASVPVTLVDGSKVCVLSSIRMK